MHCVLLFISVILKVLKQAANIMVHDPTAEGKNEKKAKVHISAGNLMSSDANKLEQALRYINKGIEIEPGLPNAHNSKGSVLHKMGRLEEAKTAFQEALRLNPNYANAHFNLGLVLYQTGDAAGAVQEYQTVLKIDPNHEMARQNLRGLQGIGLSEASKK